MKDIEFITRIQVNGEKRELTMPPHMVSLAFIVNVDVSSLYVPEKVLLATKSAILIKFTVRFSDATSTKTMYINPLYREVAPYMRNDA